MTASHDIGSSTGVSGSLYSLATFDDSPLATAPTLKAVVRFYKNAGCIGPLETTEAVLLVDGFETGDTGWWSSSSP